jgi:asparagine synthase (glutamine-hydrolysing)
MSMSHGLEVRPVLLHHPLVEFAFALPEQLKMRASDGKWVLKRAIERICPLNFAGRAKRGFELPLGQWAVGALREETEGALESKSARMLLDNSYRESLLRNIRLGKASFELWAWLVLFSWANAERIDLTTG